MLPIREYTGTGVQSGLAQVVAAQVMGDLEDGNDVMYVNTLASAGGFFKNRGILI